MAVLNAPRTEPAPAIPFIDLAAQRERLGSRMEAAIARVLEHGQYILGPEVETLEESLAEFCGARHCVSCANGTDALTLVGMAEGVGTGDAVFVPSFTFVATAEAFAQLRATPVFVDVHDDTFNMDPASLECAIESARKAGLKPRMTIAVDLFGQPADYSTLRDICHANDLILVADAAQSYGAELEGKKAGALADYTTTSFFPAKPLGCYGDGGAAFTENAERDALLRSLRFHGKGEHRYDNVRVGLNSRLDTIQAAILLEKLKIFPYEISARNAVAERYSNALSGAVKTPLLAPGATSVWAQYTVVLPEDADRDRLQDYCSRAGVPTVVYYPKPLHLQPSYDAPPRGADGLPATEQLAQRVLSLPMHPYLDPDTQDYIIETFLAGVREQS